MMPREEEHIADRTATAPSRIVLLGRDHERPAAVATRAVADDAAVGLARGWRPKPYAYVDPNEDAAGCVVGRRARLLVVADGHNGRQASHAAVGAVMDLLGGDPPPADLADDEVFAAVQLIEDRIALATADGDGSRSRTTLVVALRTPTQLQWFGAGDSALLVSERGLARRLPVGARWFFGDGPGRHTVRRSLARGRIDLAPWAWVVLATDGYTDYLPDGLTPEAAVARALVGLDDVERAVGALLDQAREGGAGDNVGVSVCGPWYTPHDGHDHHSGRHG
jgi:serine/threonine protein phosphatase PrpC